VSSDLLAKAALLGLILDLVPLLFKQLLSRSDEFIEQLTKASQLTRVRVFRDLY
jgi:hypothetical protein